MGFTDRRSSFRYSLASTRRLLDRRALALVATTVTAAFAAAGCGGGSDGNVSVADAKAKLSKDCQEGKASDKKLCDCIADELAKGGKSGKQLDDIRKQVNDGHAGKEVTQAGGVCGVKLAKQATGG